MSRSPLTGLPLSQPAVDRDGEARTRPALFDELWGDAATRILPLWQGRALIREPLDAAEGASLVLLPVEDASSALVRVYLGRILNGDENLPAGTPVVTTVLTDAAATELEPDESRWVNLRAAATTLDDRDAGLFTEALAITNWHASHTHCPRCGTPTVVEVGGWVRKCPVDNTEIFPRTDAAVIVSVIDQDDRLLLGSNALWENNRYSLLAGFVEPGESFEAAAIREVGEEAGIRIAEPQYLGSQPWPFPASIMVGMTATLAEGQRAEDLIPDGEEILSLRWFSRDDLWEERDSLLLPGGASIAHAIVKEWYGGPLDEPAPSSRTLQAR